MLQNMGQKKAFAEQQLALVKQQMAAKKRESRMLQLTASEVDALPKDTRVYEGVGKMYARATAGQAAGTLSQLMQRARFVCTPAADVQKRLRSDDADIKADMSSLTKKMDYMELTYQNSRKALEQVLGKA